MCRLTAVVRKDVLKEDYVYPDMLIDIQLKLSNNQHRDGFGMFLSSGNEMYKKSLPCDQVVNTQDFVDWLRDANDGLGITMCHVRQATVGKVWSVVGDKHVVAHPFQLDNLTLVHNGHFINSYDVKRKFRIDEKVEVDSEVFLHLLNKMSAGNPLSLEIIQKTVDEFIGPFVIFVHENLPDVREGIWILMGKDRTMHLYECDGAYIFCTESGVKDIVNRNLGRRSSYAGYPYNPVDKVFRLDQDTLYRCEPSGIVRYGDLNSLAERPKLTVVKDIESPVSTVKEVTDVSTLCKRTSLRKELLAKFCISELDLDSILEALSPLLPSDGYCLTMQEVALLAGFLKDLESRVDIDFKSADNPEKTNIWSNICGLSPKPETVCTQINKDFYLPYLLNPIEVLNKCLSILRGEEIVQLD